MAYRSLFVIFLDLGFLASLEDILDFPLDIAMNISHENLQVFCRRDKFSPRQASHPISCSGFAEGERLIDTLGAENDHVYKCVVWFVLGLWAIPEDATCGEYGVDCIKDDLWGRHG